ncbi:MAG TPA: ribokinase [Rectinemataceae bacterium]|nr:ribokinase [Rectinemataceae bacterium]
MPEGNVRVLDFGSLNIDYVYKVDNFLKPGETKPAQSLTVFAGGKGLNQALALARAGADVAQAGKVGGEGAFLVEKLKAAGVDISRVETSNLATGHTIIQVDDAGRNCILLFGGANRDIDAACIERALVGFGRGDLLLLQNEITSIAPIMRAAKARGMTIVMNPSPYDGNIATYPLELIDIFMLNEIEVVDLAGGGEPEAAAWALGKRFPEARIVVTLGAEGSLCIEKGCLIRQKAYKVKAVDTTAAGDTFTGYFLAGLLEGMDTGKALDLGARAASICVTRMGAADSVPLRAEVK